MNDQLRSSKSFCYLRVLPLSMALSKTNGRLEKCAETVQSELTTNKESGTQKEKTLRPTLTVSFFIRLRKHAGQRYFSFW